MTKKLTDCHLFHDNKILLAKLDRNEEQITGEKRYLEISNRCFCLPISRTQSLPLTSSHSSSLLFTTRHSSLHLLKLKNPRPPIKLTRSDHQAFCRNLAGLQWLLLHVPYNIQLQRFILDHQRWRVSGETKIWLQTVPPPNSFIPFWSN